MKQTRRVAMLIAAGMVALAGCVHRARPFDEYFASSRWIEASEAFMADPSLMSDERALYQAGVLYGTAGRPTYRPRQADSLFRRLLTRFPETKYRAQAAEHLAGLAVGLRQRDSVAALERRLAQLTATIQSLRQRLDSATTQGDSLRRNGARLEAELKDRDDQLRSLRLELQRLKEIDLKSSQPPRKPPA